MAICSFLCCLCYVRLGMFPCYLKSNSGSQSLSTCLQFLPFVSELQRQRVMCSSPCLPFPTYLLSTTSQSSTHLPFPTSCQHVETGPSPNFSYEYETFTSGLTFFYSACLPVQVLLPLQGSLMTSIFAPTDKFSY